MKRNTRPLRIESLESRWAMDAAGAAMSTSVLAEGEGPPRPDFQLEDVNPASARFGETVSPRDYQAEVSAWYFGHST